MAYLHITIKRIPVALELAMDDKHNAMVQREERLAKAAPELLAALRALLEDAIELGIYEGNMSGSAVAARNAINKATGGAA
jgi:hypothetical protein